VALQAQKVKPVHIVDVPGHPKVRNRFEGYIHDARGIVFVVDSVDFMGQKTAVAEYDPCLQAANDHCRLISEQADMCDSVAGNCWRF